MWEEVKEDVTDGSKVIAGNFLYESRAAKYSPRGSEKGVRAARSPWQALRRGCSGKSRSAHGSGSLLLREDQ